jgi:hypothetical protein
MPIHSTHSHRASEDIEEDPTRAIATRSCHCVRDMAILSDNTLTSLPGSPFLQPVLLWARSCSRTKPFAFTSLARTIRDLNCRMQRAERRLVKQKNWPEAMVEHVKLSFADGGIISQYSVHKRNLHHDLEFLPFAPSLCKCNTELVTMRGTNQSFWLWSCNV